MNENIYVYIKGSFIAADKEREELHRDTDSFYIQSRLQKMPVAATMLFTQVLIWSALITSYDSSITISHVSYYTMCLDIVRDYL